MVIARSLGAWLLIMLAETVHGVLRQGLLAPLVGDFRSRQIAVFTGVAIIFGIAWLTIRWIGATRRGPLLAIGAMWVALTVAFEVTLGRALGYDWARLLSDYDIRHGGLLGLGLLAMFLTPLVASRLRTRGR